MTATASTFRRLGRRSRITVTAGLAAAVIMTTIGASSASAAVHGPGNGYGRVTATCAAGSQQITLHDHIQSSNTVVWSPQQVAFQPWVYDSQTGRWTNLGWQVGSTDPGAWDVDATFGVTHHGRFALYVYYSWYTTNGWSTAVGTAPDFYKDAVGNLIGACVV